VRVANRAVRAIPLMANVLCRKAAVKKRLVSRESDRPRRIERAVSQHERCLFSKLGAENSFI
jgi:hypothetical protein